MSRLLAGQPAREPSLIHAALPGASAWPLPHPPYLVQMATPHATRRAPRTVTVRLGATSPSPSLALPCSACTALSTAISTPQGIPLQTVQELIYSKQGFESPTDRRH